MSHSRTRSYHLSRDSRALLRIASVIGLIGLALGFLISISTSNSRKLPFFSGMMGIEIPDPLATLPEADADFEEWAGYVRELVPFAGFDEDEMPGGLRRLIRPQNPAPASPEEILSLVEKSIGGSHLPEAERDLLRDLFIAFHRNDHSKAAIERLRAASRQSPVQRHSAESLGDALARNDDIPGAIDAYRLEMERRPADDPGRALNELAFWLAHEDRHPERDVLMDTPEYSRFFSFRERLDRAVDRRDHVDMLKYALLLTFVPEEPWLVPLSLFAAAIWFIIVTQFAGWDRRRLLFYAAALALGCLSAAITIYAILLQEHLLHFTLDYDADPVSQLIYWVAGVGLREETLKLLCFLPLVPFLTRKGAEIDALVCAGICGLGFALAENIGYVSREGAFTTWGRFLSANFAHIAWTGIAGLALVRAWRWPKRNWDNFLYDFLIVVAAHGAYDALIAMPSLADYSFFYLVVFALTAYVFLDRATDLMQPRGSMRASPLAVFVVGGALLVAVVFCYACWALPFRAALAGYAMAMAEVIPIAFVFINRLRNL